MDGLHRPVLLLGQCWRPLDQESLHVHTLTKNLDALLAGVTSGPTRVPGVVAMVTDTERTLYTGVAGHREVDGDAMTSDSMFALYSATKAVTATAALALVEDGALDLTAPVRSYLPHFAELQVLTGFDAQGQPVVRPPATEATVLHLLTHTSGLGYEFFDEQYGRMVSEHGQPRINDGTREALMAPLLCDPGTRWKYGIGIDWAGQVIEAVTGKGLGEVFAERIFTPLGMTDTTFEVSDEQAARLARVHVRSEGALKPIGRRPRPTPIEMGGQGLFGTAGDYVLFLRMWLAQGHGEHGQVLRPETVEWALRNHLADGLQVSELKSSNTFLTLDTEFFPGLPKSWSIPFMINDHDAPTGRPAGSQAWAGLANLYYWIDPHHQIAGIWATQILPFSDPTSLNGFIEMETEVYRHLDAITHSR